MLKTSGNTAYSELSDEELAIAAQSGDREAEYALVVRFMGLVKLKAGPYFLVGADRADLIQEGSIGLIAAVRRQLQELRRDLHHTPDVHSYQGSDKKKASSAQ